MKHDLRRKARLVAGGHLVDVPTGIDVYSSHVKPISVKLLHVIAHKQGLKVLCGDISNAYVNAETTEKVYAKAGPEFGDRKGKIVIIKKALYGLVGSSKCWHSHFAGTLRSFGFVPTRYDGDVWIRRLDGAYHYEYICTHVDDFSCFSKNPEAIMEQIKSVYSVKGEGPPDYYLGNDYKLHGGRWAVGCKKFLTEAIARVEKVFGKLKKNSVPLVANDHPKEDTSELLNDDDHRKYKILIGMLNWIVSIGRFDIAHATSSMARFSGCPRKGHLARALRIFGYQKKRRNRRILMDSRDPIIQGGDFQEYKNMAKKLLDEYPEAAEEIDSNLPEALVDEIPIHAFVDSDHAHAYSSVHDWDCYPVGADSNLLSEAELY